MTRHLVYGRRAVEEARRGRRRVLREWTTEELPEERLTELAGSSDHQGVVAEVEPYPYADPTTLLAGEDALVVALDQVQDPQNLGAIARSAEVAGATGLVITERRAPGITAAVCRASAGAVEHLSVARVGNLADWLTAAKEQDAWIYGADEDADKPPWDVDLTGRVVLVLGAEGTGLRPRVAASCDVLCALPQRGRIESLNVSAAASALLFEALRQRMQGAMQ